MLDPITALTIFGGFFSALSGVEKIYSVVYEGAPIINTERYKPINGATPPVTTVGHKKIIWVRPKVMRDGHVVYERVNHR